MRINKNTHPENFFIVGIGASAGGLEAIDQLLSNLPPHPGVAIIIAQHLDPIHKSMAVDIFSRITSLTVTEAQNGMRVEPDHVYVLPRNRTMKIINGKLKLYLRNKFRDKNMPIDSFFQSLAKDQKNYAIGIVLSGTGTDGTRGLSAIKAAGGITIAQDLTSAKYEGMPHSAITAHVVDIILPPTDIPKELIRLTRPPFPHNEAIFSQILMTLQTKCNVDFSHYKGNTLKRRIKRRMAVQKKTTLKEYLEFLQDNADEAKFLFADILINVTEFFRDIRCFDALKKKVFPSLMKEKNPDNPIRIWIVGCATGEEAYSVAMALMEYSSKPLSRKEIQIFATDISETVIQHARTGIYPASITSTVSKERLQRFFEKTKTGYRINKSIREMCLFSIHDITKDPPFSKIDFICCRNLLIYFDSVLQKYILSVFYYALKSGGFLWLGHSETIGQSTLFDNLDKPNKIYTRSLLPSTSKFLLPLNRALPEKSEHIKKNNDKIDNSSYFQQEMDRITASIYAPPGIIINSKMEIVFIRGETSPYLQLHPGQASFHLFKLARPDIIANLRMVIQTAKKKNMPTIKKGLKIGTGEDSLTFDLEVIPLAIPSFNKERYFLIAFDRWTPTHASTKHLAQKKEIGKKHKKHSGESSTEQELTEIKAYQQLLIQDFYETQEQLTSANENLQSTNEELQSTNEELETAKEELQSINEELTTVNDELQTRNNDLIQLSNDLTNLIDCIDIPLVMVNVTGKIRRFTPEAGKIMNLFPSDIGRPISDFKPNVNIPDLEQQALEVIKTITPKEFEVQDREKNWFRLQIRPYKTASHRTDGAVIALFDINILKKNLEANKALLDYTVSITNTIQTPLVVLNNQLHIVSANAAFYKKFRLIPENHNPENKIDFFSLLSNKIDSPHVLQTALRDVITKHIELENLELHCTLSNTEHYIMLASAKKINWIHETEPQALLLSMLDITESHTLQKVTIALAIRNQANEEKDIFLTALSHELRTPLTPILSWAQLLLTQKLSPKLKHGLEIIEQNASLQAQLIDDLLDLSHIQSGKLTLHMDKIDPNTTVHMAVESVRSLAEKTAIKIKMHLSSAPITVSADPARLQQVVWNFLTNAIKFSSPKGIIDVYVTTVEAQGKSFATITVIDYGKGISASFLPKVFERFTQANISTTRTNRGLGIGLSIARDLIKAMGGDIRVESEGEGKGSTFTVLLPLIPHRITQQKDRHTAALPNIAGLKILIVEDETDTLEAVTELLHSANVITLPTRSVTEALAALNTFKPDILISDISMHEEDGYTLIKKIRKNEKNHTKKINALALTAHASKEDINKALSSGFDAHLGKPFKTIELFQLLEKLRNLT